MSTGTSSSVSASTSSSVTSIVSVSASVSASTSSAASSSASSSDASTISSSSTSSSSVSVEASISSSTATSSSDASIYTSLSSSPSSTAESTSSSSISPTILSSSASTRISSSPLITSSMSNSSTSSYTSSTSISTSLPPSSSTYQHSSTLTFYTTHSTQTPSQSFYTSTYLTTMVITSAVAGGGDGSSTMISTATVSGTLSSNSGSRPSNRDFAHNRGAIAGVVVGGLVALCVAAIWIFVARRRHKESQIDPPGSSPHAINFSPDGIPRRSPLDDDHSSRMAEPYGGLLTLGSIASSHHSKEAPAYHEGADPSSSGHGHSNVHRPGTAEGVVLTRHSSFANSPYMTGFGQAAEAMAATVPLLDNGKVSPGSQENLPPGAAAPLLNPRPFSSGLEPSSWLGGGEIDYGSFDPSSHSNGSSSHGHSTALGPTHGYSSRRGSGSSADNAIRVSPHPGSSSSYDATFPLATSSSSGHASSIAPLLPPGEANRSSLLHGETPPTSYTFKPKDDSDSRSLKGLLGRLRGGRGSSPDVAVHNVSTHDHSTILPAIAPSPTGHANSRPAHTTWPRSPAFRPVHTPPPSSLLNPRSSSLNEMPDWDKQPLDSNDSGRKPWHGTEPLTLPPMPSPVITDDTRLPDGLLDPRLVMRMGNIAQESSTSLRDHLDYSRPIGGLVNNRMDSTTTFKTQDTEDIIEPTEPSIS